nr:aldehyde dehydrogenase family protein [Pseudarthrobacter sp. NIBRBAC000502770]
MSRVLIKSSTRNTGRTCYISTRILAPASRYDEVVDMVTASIAAGKQGDPWIRTRCLAPAPPKRSTGRFCAVGFPHMQPALADAGDEVDPLDGVERPPPLPSCGRQR